MREFSSVRGVVGGCIAASAAVKVGTSWSNCRFLELCEMRRERYTVISYVNKKRSTIKNLTAFFMNILVFENI
jgi:hypothetical protein